MSKKYHLYQVDASTKQWFRGNPAGVVLDAGGLTEFQMQEATRELSNSETALVFSSDSPECDVEVRFFTPVRGVPMYGHATVAAHYVHALEQNLPSGRIMQKVGAGILPVDIVHENDSIRIAMAQGLFHLGLPFEEAQKQELCAVLRLSLDQLREGWPVQGVSTGFSKIMVSILGEEVLDNLEPDQDVLCHLSEEIGYNDYYAFAPAPQNTDYLYYGKMFTPISDVHEDPVAGNANRPLGGYLAHCGLRQPTDGQLRFSVLQDKAIDRARIITVGVDLQNKEPVEAWISGSTVTVFHAGLELQVRGIRLWRIPLFLCSDRQKNQKQAKDRKIGYF